MRQPVVGPRHLPVSNERKLDFEVEYRAQGIPHLQNSTLYREIQPGTIVYFRSVNAGRRWVIALCLEQWQGGRAEREMDGEQGQVAPESKRPGASPICDGARGMRSRGGAASRVEPFWIRRSTMSMARFRSALPGHVHLGWTALHAAIDREKAKGSGGERLLAIGVPHAHFQRLCHICDGVDWGECGQPQAARGDGHSLLIGVVVGFVYVFQRQTDVGFGHPRGHPTCVAAWTPNVLFGAWAVSVPRARRSKALGFKVPLDPPSAPCQGRLAPIRSQAPWESIQKRASHCHSCLRMLAPC